MKREIIKCYDCGALQGLSLVQVNDTDNEYPENHHLYGHLCHECIETLEEAGHYEVIIEI